MAPGLLDKPGAIRTNPPARHQNAPQSNSTINCAVRMRKNIVNG